MHLEERVVAPAVVGDAWLDQHELTGGIVPTLNESSGPPGGSTVRTPFVIGVDEAFSIANTVPSSCPTPKRALRFLAVVKCLHVADGERG